MPLHGRIFAVVHQCETSFRKEPEEIELIRHGKEAGSYLLVRWPLYSEWEGLLARVKAAFITPDGLYEVTGNSGSPTGCGRESHATGCK